MPSFVRIRCHYDRNYTSNNVSSYHNQDVLITFGTPSIRLPVYFFYEPVCKGILALLNSKCTRSLSDVQIASGFCVD
jgi:hypothetical protein